MGAKLNLAGQIINNVKIICEVPKVKGRIHWKCECHCGKEFISNASKLKTGYTKSCGCICKKLCSELGKNSRKWKTNDNKLYAVWHSMIRRCCDKKHKQYQEYGGRGISIYYKWRKSFDAYADWINSNLGPKPTDSHSIDRINNNKGYYPKNLKWSSKAEQAQNTRRIKLTIEQVKEIRSSSLSRKELVKKYNVSIDVIFDIINNKTWRNI